MTFASSVSTLPSHAPQSPELAPAVARLGREAPLPYAFDAVLGVTPEVRSFASDPQAERLAQSLDLAKAGLVFRSVTRTTGRGISLVAVPSACWRDPVLRARVLDLKRAAEAGGRRLLLVPESVVRAEPRLTNALLVSACNGVGVTPRERLVLLSHLAELGGSAPLEACTEWLGHSVDPAGAVLRLVAERVLTITLDRPIDLVSEVSLAAWR